MRAYGDKRGKYPLVAIMGMYGQKGREMFLYKLQSQDIDLVSHLTLKDGQAIYRFATETSMISGGFSLVKANIHTGIAYFLTDDAIESEVPEFDTRGVKFDYGRVSKETF